LCSGKSLCWALHGNGVHFVSPNRLLKCSRRIRPPSCRPRIRMDGVSE
jgi:hypothetical protein